jgi:hypothetical protein
VADEDSGEPFSLKVKLTGVETGKTGVGGDIRLLIMSQARMTKWSRMTAAMIETNVVAQILKVLEERIPMTALHLSIPFESESMSRRTLGSELFRYSGEPTSLI